MNEIEAYIRQSALQHGIDPDIAVRVAKSEGGLNDPVRRSDYSKGGYREPSYGPFQLLIGGAGTGFGGGLGNRALASGIDPRDPNQWQKAVDFALAEAGRRGWGQWYGAARAGIGNFQGIGEHPAAGQPEPKLTVQHPNNPTVGSTGPYNALGEAAAAGAGKGAGDALAAYTAAGGVSKDKEKKSWGDAIAEGLGGMGDAIAGGGGGGFSQAPPRGVVPTQQPVPQQAAPMIAETASDRVNREMLAQLLAKYRIA